MPRKGWTAGCTRGGTPGIRQRRPFPRKVTACAVPTMWTRIPELMLCRAIVFIGPTARPGLSVRVFEAQQTVLFALFVGGLWISRAQWRRFFILYLAYFCFGVLMLLVFFASSRYRLYSDPMIMVFAAAYLVWLVEKLRSRRLRKRERAASPQGAS